MKNKLHMTNFNDYGQHTKFQMRFFGDRVMTVYFCKSSSAPATTASCAPLGLCVVIAIFK